MEDLYLLEDPSRFHRDALRQEASQKRLLAGIAHPLRVRVS